MTETTALGAGFLALVGIGACGTLVEASERTARISQRFELQPAAQAIYGEVYSVYRELYSALVPVFERAAGLPGAASFFGMIG